eukprot:scaffold95203_cov32-Prasinocladus_malaysianus.AAC.6
MTLWPRFTPRSLPSFRESRFYSSDELVLDDSSAGGIDVPRESLQTLENYFGKRWIATASGVEGRRASDASP